MDEKDLSANTTTSTPPVIGESTEPSPVKAPSATKYPFGAEMESFLHRLDSLRVTFPTFQHTLGIIGEACAGDLSRFLQVHLEGPPKKESDGSVTYRLGIERLPEFRKLGKSFRRLGLAQGLANSSFLTIFVSQFDVLISRLIRGMFAHQPDLLFGCKKELQIHELMRFTNIEEAKEFCIEREIEDVLRCSHSDQFAWLERKLGIPLLKGLTIWPEFIELTERRNLIVHTDGIVSSQYKKVCAFHKATQADKFAIGDKITIDSNYLLHAFDVLVNVGIKLAYVMWRKLAESESNDADNMLNSICVELITQDRFELAIELLRFPESIKRRVSRECHLMMQINLAQALKWRGQEEHCLTLLRSIEFAPLADRFKLANAVLTDKYDEAAALVRRIGKDTDVGRLGYLEWPLFRSFRRTTQFKDAYREVFGSEVTIDAQTHHGGDAQGNVTFAGEAGRSLTLPPGLWDRVSTAIDADGERLSFDSESETK